jgi:hypothetical protein
MSTFVKVNSVEKGCPVIINLDHVVEIAPWAQGGCAVRFVSDGSGSVREIRVDNDFKEFQQFVLETVTADHISKKVKELKKMQEKLGDKETVPLKNGEGDEIPSFTG